MQLSGSVLSDGRRKRDLFVRMYESDEDERTG